MTMATKAEALDHILEGYEAARRRVEWWNNPHPSGSTEAYAWDKGHTQYRLANNRPEARAA
jgi:hypothetical protein